MKWKKRFMERAAAIVASPVATLGSYIVLRGIQRERNDSEAHTCALHLYSTTDLTPRYKIK